MLLYLTGKDRVNLLDFVEDKIGIVPKKMTGKFSLMQFVVRDMRNYAHMKYFVIDRTAVNEDEVGFVEAVDSFRTMFSARIIVICEGCSEHDAFLRQLIMAGMTDIVTATDIKEIQSEILECLSPDGMQRYKVPAQKLQPSTIAVKSTPVSEKYIFTCKDIRIAVTGCQRRVGNLRLLCGSAMPYELVYMQNAMNRCKGMTVQTLGMCVPLDIRKLIQQAISNDILFVDPSHELFDGNANGNLNKKLVSNYITRTIDGIEAVQEL